MQTAPPPVADGTFLTQKGPAAWSHSSLQNTRCRLCESQVLIHKSVMRNAKYHMKVYHSIRYDVCMCVFSAIVFLIPPPQFARRGVLCRTLAGNVVDVLTVTDFQSSAAEIAARKVSLRQCYAINKSAVKFVCTRMSLVPRVFYCKFPFILQVIFLSARVHPGEVNSSWMMKGIEGSGECFRVSLIQKVI